MSNIQVEGFGTYGTGPVGASAGLTDVGRAMLSGVWAQLETSAAVGGIMNGLPWSADGRVWLGLTQTAEQLGARRVLPTTFTKAVAAFRFAIPQLPASGQQGSFSWRNAANTEIAVLRVTTTGALEVSATRAGATLLSSSGPVIVAEGAALIEFMCEPATGSVEVRVNTVTVLSGTGLALGSALPLAQYTLAGFGNSINGITTYFADLIIRSFAGTYNNGFVGDRAVATLLVNRDDVAHQGWTARPLQEFGTGILQNVGTNRACVTAAQSTDFNFGSGDFTIEGMHRFASLPAATDKAQLFGKWEESSNNRSWRLYKGGPSLNGGNTRFEISTGGTAGTLVTVLDWPWQPDIGRYYHLAVVRASGNTMLFIDGIMQGLPVADANTYFAASTFTSLLAQMGTGAPVAGTAMDGWQDEFRITKGVARYTSNFAPPVAAFPRGGGDPNWASVVWLSGWDSGVFDESSFARTLTVRGSAAAITPNDGPPGNYKVARKNAPRLDDSFLEAALINATGTFTMSALPTAGETVTLGTKDGTNAAVYTFRAVVALAYDVLIGATVADTAANLVAAINAGAGVGTAYGSGTLSNWDASGQVMPSGQVLATANVAGTVGNAIASTETCANAAWTAATLTGGQNIPPYSQFGWDRPPNKTTVIDSLTLVSRAWKTDAGPAVFRQSFVAPAGAVANGAQYNLGTAPSYYLDTFEEDPDINAPLTPTAVVNGLQRINRLV